MLPDIHDQAQGRWRGILATLGMSQRELSGKHGPCPLCGGTDRFRFDNKDGRGTWFCNSCGAGTGIDLAMKLKGWAFKEAVSAIRPMIGGAAPEPAKSGPTDDEKRAMRLDLWRASAPVQKCDPVDTYLTGRGIDRPQYAPALRYCPQARYAEGKTFQAMVAAVQAPDGQAASLHRTFLLDGEKAPVDAPKMLMPGEIPDGAAIRLSPVATTMGVAEGIETALAAWEIFGVPTWACVSSSILAKWAPPEGVHEVYIFGDNDPGFAGQAAAYALARSLSRRKLTVHVRIPDEVGTDWADKIEREAMGEVV